MPPPATVSFDETWAAAPDSTLYGQLNFETRGTSGFQGATGDGTPGIWDAWQAIG